MSFNVERLTIKLNYSLNYETFRKSLNTDGLGNIQRLILYFDIITSPFHVSHRLAQIYAEDSTVIK